VHECALSDESFILAELCARLNVTGSHRWGGRVNVADRRPKPLSNNGPRAIKING